MTWRQVDMYYQACLRRRNHRRADAIESVGAGMSGGRGVAKLLCTLRGKG